MKGHFGSIKVAKRVQIWKITKKVQKNGKFNRGFTGADQKTTKNTLFWGSAVYTKNGSILRPKKGKKGAKKYLKSR
jgi:hypothetical protein